MYDMVIVDEAQDMSPAQLILAKILAGENGRLCYVGDNAQAIYGFRGADSDILARAAKEMSAETLLLNITYRCPKKIVELAQRYVPDFVAASEAPEGEVHEMVLERFMLEQAGAGDFILCRANAPLMSVCLKLIANGTRAYMKGRDVGEKLMGILRKIQGRKAFQDMADLELRLDRWKDKEDEKIARTSRNPEQASSRYEAIEDIRGIFHALAEGLEEPCEIEGELRRLFQEPGLTNQDFVCCSTVHKAKGLEADNVFILAQGFNRPGQEEDNIRYVAITRAKKRLYAVGFCFEGGTGKSLNEALKEASEALELGDEFTQEGEEIMQRLEDEAQSDDQEAFEGHLLEAESGEFAEVTGGDFAGRYRVSLITGAAEGFADNWREVRALLEAWLPGREWKLDGVAWFREANIFASAQKFVPKAFAEA